MPCNESFETAVVKFLSSRSGFSVCPIEPEPGKGRRADFVVVVGNTSCIVELKTFQDVSLDWHDCIPGEVQSASVRVEALPKIRRAFKQAMRQVSETLQAGIAADFNIVWVNAHETVMLCPKSCVKRGDGNLT